MSREFTDRYRERGVANPREMLASRHAKVDLSKWEPVPHDDPSPRKTLTARCAEIVRMAARAVGGAARRSR